MNLVFAYGSNLSTEQMCRRCPSARIVASATLQNYRLEFAGWSYGWRGAVANVRRTPGARTDGVVFELDAIDLARLDRFEGVPSAYIRRPLIVHSPENMFVAHVYMQARPVRSAVPSLPYVARIGEGYLRHGLDPKPLIEAVRECGRTTRAMRDAIAGRVSFQPKGDRHAHI